MHNILLIEDSGVFREVEVTLLKLIDNISLEIAINHKNALSLIDKKKFDL